MTMTRSDALREFSRKLSSFYSAGALLAEAWDTLDNVDGKISREISKKYPFRDDFIETLLRIGEWNEWVKVKMKLGPKDWRPS